MIPNVLILQILRLNCSPLLLVYPLNHRRHDNTNRKHNQDKNFLGRLSDEQIKRLEMSFRYKAKTYQISDIFKDDFQLVDDYNSLINALNVSDLKDYYAVIVQELSKRKQNC